MSSLFASDCPPLLITPRSILYRARRFGLARLCVSAPCTLDWGTGGVAPMTRPSPPRVADEAGYVVTLHTVYAHTRGVNDINRLICHSEVGRATVAYGRQVDRVRADDCGLLRMIG